jgi:uncharacterized protein YbjT (DUF2867 family)
MSKTIIVTGATGKQGGSIVNALRDTDFEILALTRNTSSPSAQRLAKLPNVKLLEGDLENVKDVFLKAKMFTVNPIWGVYSVQAKVSGPDKTIEETQGKGLIDAAIANNVKFFVYSSVDRGGAKSSSTPTPVPHWATKHNIEKHLEKKAAGKMQYTVLRPTAFMDGFTNDFMGKAMATMWRTSLSSSEPLQLIATKDIGNFAALAFKNPDKFAGKYLSIAGATLTFEEANLVFKQKVGTDMPQTFGFVGKALLHVAKDIGIMFKWLKEEGTGADIDECRRLYPGLTSFGEWLEKDSAWKKA